VNRWLCLALALTAAAFASSLYVYFAEYDRLPEGVPVHWNIHGEVDRTVPREDALPYLLLVPGVMAGMVVLTLVLPWLSPRQFEVERFRKVYDYLMALVVALFGYLHVVVLWSCLDGEAPGRLLVGGFFLFFMLLGNVLGQVRRNFWMGVRTPWTLASDRVWVGTHRLAAWLFVALGVAGFVAVLAGVSLVWCFAALIAVAAVLVLYSLVLYKRLERQGRL
jgi:uncharacterized membrane protein